MNHEILGADVTGGYRTIFHRLSELAPRVLSFQSTAYRYHQSLVYLGSLLVFGNILIASLLRNELHSNCQEH